jgi:hypothetical protein
MIRKTLFAIATVAAIGAAALIPTQASAVAARVVEWVVAITATDTGEVAMAASW